MSDTPRLVVGPFNRVEGDLEVHLDLAGGAGGRGPGQQPALPRVRAHAGGPRPSDALTLTPRICGICSISQSAAAARALGAAMGLAPTDQGAWLAALIHAVENVSDHLVHFNLFFMPDFTRPCYAARPWYPRAVARFAAIEGQAGRAAIAARSGLMHILGLMAGKWPHTLALQPGGVTRTPGPRDILRIQTELRMFRKHLETQVFGGRLEDFVVLASVADLLRWDRGDAGLFVEIAADLDLDRLGRGAGRYLSFGAYPLAEGHGFAPGLWQAGAVTAPDMAAIAEDLSHAWMLGGTAHPFDGVTRPDETMREGAYSWCKAPRLGGQPVEVGGAGAAADRRPSAGGGSGGGGVLARVAGRLLELARTQLLMETWAAALDPGAVFMVQGRMPETGAGAGLVEAARGSLGHWLRIEGGKIASYQIIAPTTWNFSPRQRGRARAAGGGAGRRPGCARRGQSGCGAACRAQFRSLHGLHRALSAVGALPPHPRDI
ncbi:nickel-dependent hydrogenase large subunit [Rhodobacter capsulatus]|uniref:nickel-dependent hydrogenase large subunit n=1 Tax=Rhodobacter capsulatus TaxID=1061 RepID=UPI004028C4D0